MYEELLGHGNYPVAISTTVLLCHISLEREIEIKDIENDAHRECDER